MHRAPWTTRTIAAAALRGITLTLWVATYPAALIGLVVTR